MKRVAKIVEAAAMDLQKISDASPSPTSADLELVREQIVQLVCNHACEMVLGTIEEANKGHYAAMKFLFEMTALYPESRQEEIGEGDGLAKLLLEQLGISPETEGDAVTEGLQNVQVETRHAVK